MQTALWVISGLGVASLLCWLWLTFARGWFWKVNPSLHLEGERAGFNEVWPSVAAVIPARNEALLLPHTLPTLLHQDYPGPFRLYLVDDRSDDGTGDVALRVAKSAELADRLTVLRGKPLPRGWAGKVWALHQGVQVASTHDPEYLWLTDADISHSPGVLRALVARAKSDGWDLVSVMALLRASSPWERLLIPAFVFFFAKIYPFHWVSDPQKGTAAAAGGCILLRRQKLDEAGGLERVRSAIIDDCSLAKVIRTGGGRLWLGLSQEVRSLRAYEGLGPVWSMVARTAYAQLRSSPLILTGTVLGMLLLYLLPPLASGAGAVALGTGQSIGPSAMILSAGLGAWALMAFIYTPMLRWHRVSRLWAPLLPLTAMLYTLMTIDSAVQCRRGLAGGRKGWSRGLEA